MRGSRCRFVVLGVALTTVWGGATAHAGTTSLTYDSFNKPGYSLTDYAEKWANPYGLLEMDPGVRQDTRHFAGKRFNISAAPFKVGADFSVYDHLKYMATSTRSFAVPTTGSVTFSSVITASTPGTVDGLRVNAAPGPGGTWTDPFAPPAGLDLISQPVFQGQQAGVVMNMVDFCTGQLFDWFVSEDRAFPLIERLPTNVTQNTSNPDCAGEAYVGRDDMYTQIISDLPIRPGVPHTVAIRFNRRAAGSSVDYFLDGKRVAHVDRVGVPLDAQGRPYTGLWPSLGKGEELGGRIRSFTLAHGLFSLLDVFPYQHPEIPELSYSIPTGTGDPATAGNARLFGQGAIGSWDDFVVTTTTD